MIKTPLLYCMHTGDITGNHCAHLTLCNKYPYTVVRGYLARWIGRIGPNPFVPRIGHGLRSNLLHIEPTYPMSEVLNTSDFTQRILLGGFRGTDG